MKNINFKTIINNGSHEHVYELEGLQVADGGAVHVERLASDGIVTINSGPSTTYTLDAKRLEGDGEILFQHENVTLEQNASHTITMQVDSLNLVIIRVDEGNDGSVDDSIYVSGIVTGTNDTEKEPFRHHIC